MFIMYFPQCIAAGMVYRAMPPLYAVKIGGKDKYFSDNIELIKYNQRIFSQKYKLCNLDKKPLTQNELTIFFMRNADYNYFLTSMANTYALELHLFEDILTSYVENNNSVNFAKLQKLIKSKYRFMDVVKEGNVVIVKGVITKSNIAVLSDKFFEDCSIILKIIASNDHLHYYLDGKAVSINNIMNVYEKTQPTGIKRFKGLGETSPNILENSVMNPLSDRILIQYTMDDLKETFNTMREYESDRKKILSLVGDVTRDELAE